MGANNRKVAVGGSLLLHLHGNCTRVFIEVSLSNMCQPPNYCLVFLSRTDSEGECAAAQNEDAEDSEAAVPHKDTGRNNWISLDLT